MFKVWKNMNYSRILNKLCFLLLKSNENFNFNFLFFIEQEKYLKKINMKIYT